MAPVNADGFFFLNAPPDCNDVNNKATFMSSLVDVSGAIYKNRDYGLFTTDKKVGQ
ncbi:hypothetical protein ANOM_011381 [Aspergillus nomiae NRRL 13137]|uniref:Uncharacterized protein n=1 Tax=Aspergillus nomiae NRRL (strain ATCC 15546 / NRRL 13137 / CBS 260.88 / M93) TaxID=1509407 RepID=A0A0L1IRW7_ASPN3|nr:uncharacterized protein ANOM_011381 [Aspergillus nomiae NRRL 13137]KNG82237.1 hypothetical protein ANOM_011381 [Aspergillus nomiae NRRL 13137]